MVNGKRIRERRLKHLEKPIRTPLRLSTIIPEEINVWLTDKKVYEVKLNSVSRINGNLTRTLEE